MELDSYQKKAVTTNYNNVLIIAPPGSGKTHIIISRLIYLIKNKKINKHNVVVITYTKAAADNMKKRFIKAMPKEEPPFFGTFHSFFYNILRKANKDINIISYKESYNVVKNTLEKYIEDISEDNIKDILCKISFYKNNSSLENVKISERILLECYLNYENYKNNNGLLDFDDLQIKCKELFAQNKNILNMYRNKIKYILIDEFQDCDKTQIEVVRMLNSGGSLFAVGDEDQCIYSFRGSDPKCMLNFHNYFKNGKKLFLCINYRSSNNIVNMAKKIIKNNKLRNEKTILANNNFTGEIKVVFTNDEKEQGDKICYFINSWINSNKGKYSDIAILYRRNSEKVKIINNLLKNKIPFKIMEKEFNIYEHFVCKDILCYLKLSLNNKDRRSFYHIVNKPFRFINRHYINELINYPIKESCFQIIYNKNLSLLQFKNLKVMEKKLKRANKIKIENIIDYILYDLNYVDYIKFYISKYKIDKEEIETIILMMKRSIKNFKTIEEFLDYVEKIKHRKKQNKKDSLILSTMHGVKGMEFKTVFIINCNEGNIPYTDNNKFLEEERRLFYVAVTRAIENLNIFIPKYVDGTQRKVSRFLLESNLNKTLYNNSFNIGDNIFYECFGEGVVNSIDKEYITILFKDNIKREFSIDKMQNNNLIRKIQ
ncbi:ATP-dependent helicase [Clostridium rectalis]|uniref:ATP-dependent helicase n=1 Tax=Clostridium rectalis TaxID=2040295 RepID=UPI000F63BA33|nr:ATP-dependent helicase [Clostridium rectalis]